MNIIYIFDIMIKLQYCMFDEDDIVGKSYYLYSITIINAI